MSWRTVIISSRCKLDLKMGYLVVRGEEVRRIFLDEIAILLIENPAVALTGCLLSALAEKKIKVLFCDRRHMPQSEMIPIQGSYDSARKIKAQIAWDSIRRFLQTALDHQYMLLLVDACEHPKLPEEQRLIIDKDLCEI